MKFDHDILFEFLPEEDKKYFMVWDNCFFDYRLALNGRRDFIVAIYRAPFEKKVFISLDEYELRLKQKERDNKLNKIL
jgi:hypothetical protein